MELDYKAIGRRIRALRKEQKLTLEQLAERTNRSASFVGLIERGERIMSLETFCELVAALNCSADEILGMELHRINNLAYARELLEMALALSFEENLSQRTDLSAL